MADLTEHPRTIVESERKYYIVQHDAEQAHKDQELGILGGIRLHLFGSSH